MPHFPAKNRCFRRLRCCRARIAQGLGAECEGAVVALACCQQHTVARKKGGPWRAGTRNLHACASLLLILTLLSGCQSFRLANLTLKSEFLHFPYFFEEALDVKHYNEWAAEAWQQAQSECSPGMVFSEYYEKGFFDGFVDFCFGGGSGKPPLIPPRPFWKLCYRNQDAGTYIQQWQAGYEHGARAALEGGYRRQAILPALRAAGFGADEFAGPLDSPIANRHRGAIDTEHTSSRRARGRRLTQQQDGLYETDPRQLRSSSEQLPAEQLPAGPVPAEQLPTPAMPLVAPKKSPSRIDKPVDRNSAPRGVNPFRESTSVKRSPVAEPSLAPTARPPRAMPQDGRATAPGKTLLPGKQIPPENIDPPHRRTEPGPQDLMPEDTYLPNNDLLPADDLLPDESEFAPDEQNQPLPLEDSELQLKGLRLESSALAPNRRQANTRQANTRQANARQADARQANTSQPTARQADASPTGARAAATRQAANRDLAPERRATTAGRATAAASRDRNATIESSTRWTLNTVDSLSAERSPIEYDRQPSRPLHQRTAQAAAVRRLPAATAQSTPPQKTLTRAADNEEEEEESLFDDGQPRTKKRTQTPIAFDQYDDEDSSELFDQLKAEADRWSQEPPERE